MGRDGPGNGRRPVAHGYSDRSANDPQPHRVDAQPVGGRGMPRHRTGALDARAPHRHGDGRSRTTDPLRLADRGPLSGGEPQYRRPRRLAAAGHARAVRPRAARPSPPCAVRRHGSGCRSAGRRFGTAPVRHRRWAGVGEPLRGASARPRRRARAGGGGGGRTAPRPAHAGSPLRESRCGDRGRLAAHPGRAPRALRGCRPERDVHRAATRRHGNGVDRRPAAAVDDRSRRGAPPRAPGDRPPEDVVSGPVLGLSVGAASVRAVLVRRGAIAWAGLAPYAGPGELAEVIARLAGESGLPVRRARVVLERVVVQLRTFDPAPPLTGRAAGRWVALEAPRLFRKNGAPLVTDAVLIQVGRRRATLLAAAATEPLVRTV